MLVTLCLIAASLSLFGFLRSAIDGKRPGYLLNSQIILNEWLSQNDWKARFSPLFAVLIFVFNLFAWAIYGFTSVFEFIGFLAHKVWWLVMWLWNEVLHPTVFALIRLLWHYLVIFSWKFFNYAFSKIPEGVRKDNMRYALKKLLIFGAISGILVLIYLLTMHIIVLVVASLIVFYLFQYTVFSTIAYYRPNDFTKSQVYPGLRISIIWLSLSTVSTAILVLLTQFADVYIINGLSVLLIQVLLPFAVLFGLAFLATTFYLPAYIHENGEDVDVLKFLKALLFRFPKLLFSQPFQLIGLVILSIIPVFIILILNSGIKQVTGKDFPTWVAHVVVVDFHIPSVIDNNKSVNALEVEILELNSKRDSVEDIYIRNIGATRNELAEAISLKNNIADEKIHTFERTAYVGETQSFSLPEIAGCSEYEWIIRNNATNRIITRVSASTATKSGSLVLYHKWNSPGQYAVNIKTKPPCDDGIDKTIQVAVVTMPADATASDMPETKYFVTREAADYAIEMLNNQLNDYQNEKKQKLNIFDKEMHILVERTNHLDFSTKENINMLIAKVLGFFALILLSMLFLSAIWTYWVIYHYDMYSFEQHGNHYWVNLLSEIKSKNPNQPLLGIFVLIITTGVYFLITLV